MAALDGEVELNWLRLHSYKVVIDADLEFLGKGKCFFHAGGNCKDGGVGGKDGSDGIF